MPQTSIHADPKIAKKLAELQAQYDSPDYVAARNLASALKNRLYAKGFINDAQIMLEIDDHLGIHAPMENDDGHFSNDSAFAYSRSGDDLDLALFYCAQQVQKLGLERAMIDWQVYVVFQLAQTGPTCAYSAVAGYAS